MLRKCLKYDLRDMLRFWWIGAVTLLALSVPAGLGLNVYIRSIEAPETAGAGDYFGIFPVIAFYVAAIAFVVLTVIFVFRRYYRNFFTDEGYQTFTLPVRRGTLLRSKLLSAMAVVLLSVLVILCAVVVILALTNSTEGNLLTIVLNELGVWLPGAVADCGGAGWFALCIAELVLLAVLGLMQSLLFIFLCITFGAAIAKKHKLLATFGLIYGINTGISVLRLFLDSFGYAWYFSIEELAPHLLTPPGTGLLGSLVLGLGCVGMSAVVALLWFMTLGTLERKLNLA